MFLQYYERLLTSKTCVRRLNKSAAILVQILCSYNFLYTVYLTESALLYCRNLFVAEKSYEDLATLGKYQMHRYINSLDSRCLYQLIVTPGGTSVCLQRLPQPPVV
jgi:hypothetical protein